MYSYIFKENLVPRDKEKGVLGEGAEAKGDVGQLLPLVLKVEQLNGVQHDASDPVHVHNAQVIERVLEVQVAAAPLHPDVARP